MGKAVVLLFLLDTLPDLNNVINNITLVPDVNAISCFPTINAAISDVINQKLGFVSSIEQESHDLDHQSHSFEDLSSETIYNTLHDSSIQDSRVLDYFEESGNTESDNAYNVENEDVSECKKPSMDFLNFNNTISKESYLESPPFLAAIFETVSNVTAQTCGGVLVSTFWVLTAASCVNVLGHFYSNSSYHAVNNSYTIVIGASNPLKDGSVHNVTEIIVHPSSRIGNSYSKSLHSKQWFHSRKRPMEKLKSPTLALMRIDPGLKEGMLKIGEIGMDSNVTANMYGWALVQNETGHSAMLATLLSVGFLGSDKCESVYGTTELYGSLCLSLNDTSANITRMAAGAPVVSRGRVLGVALVDGAPLLASYLLAHKDWIHRVIGAD